MRRIIREEGLSDIVVEQNVQKGLGATDRATVIELGSIVYQDDSAVLKADTTLLETYVGITNSSELPPVFRPIFAGKSGLKY